MSVLEQEIIQKFHKLDSIAKQRVMEHLVSDMQSSFDYTGWWANVEALQTTIRARLGDQATVSMLSLLDELREEAS